MTTVYRYPGISMTIYFLQSPMNMKAPIVKKWRISWTKSKTERIFPTVLMMTYFTDSTETAI